MERIFLNARSLPIKMDYNVTHPMLDMETTPLKLDVQTEPFVIDIKTTPGQLDIDHTPWRYSLGLKDWTVFCQEFCEQSKQMVQEGTSRMVQEGNRMSDIHSSPAPAGQIAYDALMNDGDVSINIGRLEPPDISYTPGDVEVNITPAKPNINITPGKVDINLKRGNIDAQVQQYPRVEMWTSVNRYDIRV